MLSSLDIPKLWSGPVPQPKIIKCRDTVQVNTWLKILKNKQNIVDWRMRNAQYTLVVGDDLAVGLRSGEVQLWSLSTLRMQAVRIIAFLFSATFLLAAKENIP